VTWPGWLQIVVSYVLIITLIKPFGGAHLRADQLPVGVT